ncbi:MAG: hypothetical protein ACRD3G_12130 [Vicinamibacterales bacterium]
MSTKRDPGQFDCYAKLADDEEYFLVRAKDPDAPAVVREWIRLRRQRPGNELNPKLDEAEACARKMEAWRARNMSGRPCGCDPAANHRCEQHGGNHA